jgi:hypothetical protein
MTRDEAVAQTQQGLGFRRDLQAVIAGKLEEAQRKLESGSTLPSFIINKDDPVNILTGVNQYDLTFEFIREVNDIGKQWPLRKTSGDISHVRKIDYDDAIAQFGDAGSGCPVVYAIRARILRFFPVPDTEYEYRWSFYQRQTALDGSDVNDDDNAWLKFAPHLLIGMAGKEVAKTLRDQSAIALFSEQEATWRRLIFADTILEEDANQVYLMGADQ